MEESVSMERVTVLIRTLDMPAFKNYVRLHRHTICAAGSIYVWAIHMTACNEIGNYI